MILCANPKASYSTLKDAIDKAVRETMQRGFYIMGPEVRTFEQRFAEFLKTRHCVGVANGTDAVHLALRACGVERGDLVITASHTAVATVAAINWLGAIPVLVDIDEESFTIDPQKVKDTLRDERFVRTKAIVAVHLYGHPAALGDLKDISGQYGIALVEDCAQAHGALIGNLRVGTIGDCGAFSFYPTKNLGALGDAGAIVTQDSTIFERLRLLRQYGWHERYISSTPGYNSRLDEIQAAILNVKLDQLDAWNDRRRSIARIYDEGLAGLPIMIPRERACCRHVYHQYVICCENRELLKKHLESNGIQPAILYPVPVHLQAGYAKQIVVGSGGLKTAEKVADEILCLPIYPELEDREVHFIIDTIRDYYI